MRLKLLFALSAILLSQLSASSWAKIVDTYPHSNEEIWKVAHLIVIVEISSGYVESNGESYQITVKVLQTLKGKSTQSITISDRFSNGFANKLGEMYLVHVTHKDDKYEIIDSQNAVFELLSPRHPGSPAELRSEIEKFGHSAGALQIIDEKAWYPAVCIDDKRHCECASETLKYVAARFENRKFTPASPTCL